jgi:hypothetical protein
MLTCFTMTRVTLAGQVDVAWWISLFTYHGAKGSGSSPYVTGHINVLFPWRKKGAANGSETWDWVGSEKYKRSFPGGMNSVPMMWNYLGHMIAMTVWAGSLCACVSEDESEVAPAVCVGFTIDAAADAPVPDEAACLLEAAGEPMPGGMPGGFPGAGEAGASAPSGGADPDFPTPIDPFRVADPNMEEVD